MFVFLKTIIPKFRVIIQPYNTVFIFIFECIIFPFFDEINILVKKKYMLFHIFMKIKTSVKTKFLIIFFKLKSRFYVLYFTLGFGLVNSSNA